MSEADHANNEGARRFPTGVVLTAATGILCCDMGDVYVVYNHLTGADLFTHQLPRAIRVCKDWVVEQHPWVADVDFTGINADTHAAWLQAVVAKHGLDHDLAPLPAGSWLPIDPLTELVMQRPDAVIPVVVERSTASDK